MPKTGVWVGWYRYDREPYQHRWSAAIVSAAGGRFSGEGRDDVGAFALEGQVEGDLVRWTKRYLEMADDPEAAVHYRGKREAEGELAGEWKLPDGTRGTWGARWTDADALPDEDEFPESDAAEFDVGSFLALIREIRPLVDAIEVRYRARFPHGLPHWTELPEDALAELPGGDDAMNDLFGFFTAIDEHAFDGIG